MLSLHKVLAAALLAACVTLEHGGAAQDSVTVEVDMFSGRPNPAWRMSPRQSQAAIKMLNRLPRTTAGSLNEGLGYRGTVIRVRSSAWRIFRGRAYESKSGRWKTDDHRKLERFAIATGKSNLDPALYRTVLEESGFGQGNAEAQHEP